MFKLTKISFLLRKSAIGSLALFLILPYFARASDLDDLRKGLEEQIQQKQQEIKHLAKL